MFVDRLPAWVGPDGFPISWRHYMHGTRYIERRDARTALEGAATFRAAQGTKHDYQDWRRAMSEAADG